MGVDSTDEVWKLVFAAVYYKQYLRTFVDIYTVIPQLVFKDVLQWTATVNSTAKMLLTTVNSMKQSLKLNTYYM